MSKFTPGPFVVCNGTDVFTELGAKNAAGVSADHSDGWHVADCAPGGTFVGGKLTELDFEEQKANAQLFADAPALLDALEKLVFKLEDGGYDDEHWLHPARALIAKHRGES